MEETIRPIIELVLEKTPYIKEKGYRVLSIRAPHFEIVPKVYSQGSVGLYCYQHKGVNTLVCWNNTKTPVGFRLYVEVGGYLSRENLQFLEELVPEVLEKLGFKEKAWEPLRPVVFLVQKES